MLQERYCLDGGSDQPFATLRPPNVRLRRYLDHPAMREPERVPQSLSEAALLVLDVPHLDSARMHFVSLARPYFVEFQLLVSKSYH